MDDSSQMGALYHSIKDAGPAGMTPGEMEILTGVWRQPAGAMLGVLLINGCIERGGRRMTNGHSQEIWRST